MAAIISIMKSLSRKTRVVIGIVGRKLLKFPPIPTASRLYFGNNAGLLENMRGQAILKNSKKQGLDSTSKEILMNGFASLGDNFHKNAIVSSITTKFSNQLAEVEAVAKNPKVAYVVPLCKKIPDVYDLFDSRLNAIFDDYFLSDKWRITDITAWRNYYWSSPKSEDVNSDLWHNDESRVDTLKLFIILSNGVTKDNGATQIISIQNTKKAMRLGYFSRYKILKPARKFLENTDLINFMTGNNGGSFIFNPQICLHAAGRVQFGSIRDVLCVTVTSCNKSRNLIENFQSLSIEQEKLVVDGKSITYR